MLLRDLRAVAVDVVDLEEAVVTLAAAQLVVAQFADSGIPVPDWLTDKRDALQREIEAKKRDYLAAKLKAAKLKRQNLKTREERARDADSEIAELERQLGSGATSVPNSGTSTSAN